MQVQRSKLASLYSALGFPEAGKWSVGKLEAKLGKLEKLKEPDVDIPDKKLAGLYDDLISTQQNGEEVTIEDDGPPKAEAAQPKAKKASADGKAKAEKAGRGPGVIATIMEILTGASERKPVSKEDILAELQKAFPDRDPQSMMSTINIQVPSRLRSDKGLNVQKNADGYYVAGGKAQSARKAPVKKAKKKVKV
jgi:hypothetical protein